MLLGLLDIQSVDALKTLQLADPILHRVLPVANRRGVLHFDVFIGPAGSFNKRDNIFQVQAHHRELPLGHVPELID